MRPVAIILTLSLGLGAARAEAGGSAPEERVAPAATPLYITLSEANDAAFGTDRDRTQALELGLFAPALAASPVFWLLPALPEADAVDHGLVARWPIYTPRGYRSREILRDDRPYAAYLSLAHVLRSAREDWRLGLEAEVELGVLGPAAVGREAQAPTHRYLNGRHPRGWRHQIKTMPVINAALRAVWGAWRPWEAVQLEALGELSAGTLFCHGSLGAGLKVGRFDNLTPGGVFRDGRPQLYGILRGELRAVAYNATLQGWMFDRRSPHTIKAGDVERLVPRLRAGLIAARGGWWGGVSALGVGQEVRGGRTHASLQIELGIAF